MLRNRQNLMECGKRIRIAITQSGFKIPTFGRKHGLALSNLYTLEQGKRPLSKKLAERIASSIQKEGYYCSADWLLTGQGVAPCKQEDLENKIITRLSNDLTEVAHLLSPEFNIMKEITLFKELNPNSTVLGVFDDGMQPFYAQNDYVGGLQFAGSEIIKGVNQNCIIELFNGEKLIRKLIKSNQENSYNLVCTNPNTQISKPILYNQFIAKVAPIVWHRRVNF